MGDWLMGAAAATLGVGIFMVAAAARSDEIAVMASPAFREAYLELLPQFEKASGKAVVTTWAGTADIMRRMKAGERVDVVIIAANSLDELTALGTIVPGSRVDLAKSGVGVAVRAGASKPDIGSSEALERALLSAKSIAISSGPSGVYLAGLFQGMGIADRLKPKIKQAPPGASVGEMIARGEAEIGFQQVCELLPVAGIDLVGPLPVDVQQITVFSGGVHVGAAAPDAARALLEFLASPGSAPTIRRKGMDPG